MTIATIPDLLKELADGKAASTPTEEQLAVLEAEPRPALVIAGAGAGKTHTMVLRMLKLIAVDGADPASILGLTFTRKAAGELRERVAGQLQLLHRRGAIDAELLAVPEISTYNSFANAVYRDFALVVGREPESSLLDESSAWLLMREVVLRSDDERLAELGTARSITQTALELARALRDNRVAPERVQAIAAEFETTLELPGQKKRGKELITFLEWIREVGTVEEWRAKSCYKDVKDAVADVTAIEPYLALAAGYEDLKRRRGLIEFSDQVAGAAEICERAPGVVDELRGRAAHVILDEYQDTSAGQVAFLSGLFRDASIMAVGDPKQAIYGWRGASPGTMSRFHLDFSSEREPARQQTFTLSTSWRNDRSILAAANVVAAALDDDNRLPDGSKLPELGPRKEAGDGAVGVIFRDRLDEEADACADACAAAMTALREAEIARRGTEAAAAGATFDESDVPAPSAAMLFRKRATMSRFAEALAARGIPYRILGLGGVLSAPEVVDLVAMLRVAQDPEAGGGLIRLLVGARFELGLKDLAALHKLARSRSQRSWREGELSEAEQRAAEALDDDAESGVSLLDALEVVGWAGEDYLARREFSPEGIRRLKEAAELVRELRALGHLAPAELVDEAVRRTRLDIEIESNPRSAARQRNLDAFAAAIAGVADQHDGAPMDAILDWLEVAADRDEVSAAQDEPEPGTVQLLTVHGAKGLEWDVVIVPRLVDGEFPSAVRSARGWLAKGQLPYELKADAAALPELDWRAVQTQKELTDAMKEFRADITERAALEERRLAYVAMTRARHRLILAASEWTPYAKEPRAWAPYFAELEAAGLCEPPPYGLAAAYAEADREADAAGLSDNDRRSLRTAAKRAYMEEHAVEWPPADHPSWPRPPMSEPSLAAARAAAEAVRAALGGAEGRRDRLPATSWDERIDLLVEEARQRRRPPLVRLPGRLGASYVKDAVGDPEAMAADLLRPMPRQPGRASRLGTKFHAWVEARYVGIERGDDASLDFDWIELDEDVRGAIGLGESTADDAAVRPWMDAFLASRFADRMPVAIEQAVEMRLGRQTIICKLDAVYEDDDGIVEIVDWKTGARPRGAAEIAERQLQLQLYGLAWSRHHGIPPERLRAVLYYVADDYELAVDEFLAEDVLAAMLEAADARLEAAHAAAAAAADAAGGEG